MRAFILLCNGFEEVEALTTADMLIRAGVETVLVSPYGQETVTGAHGITVETRIAIEGSADAVILPGGQPGTRNLQASSIVNKIICEYSQTGKIVAAICAAPTVLGAAGLLKNRHCTCFPGCESKLGEGAVFIDEPAVIDGNIITGKSMGCAVDFALAVVTGLCGMDKAEELEKSIYRK